MPQIPSSAILLLVLPLSILPGAGAQVHAPDGGTRERVQSLSISPKPGAPFRATVVTEWTHLLADGTTGTVRNHRTVARDSTGRIFQERRYFRPDGDKQTTPISNLQYADPNRHEFLDCVPEQHLCTATAYFERPSPPPTPPRLIRPNGPADPVSLEDLGQKTIDNLDAVGSREITTLPAGFTGNQRSEPVVKEFWYSPRLEINLVVKRFDPRAGAQNFEVQDLDLAEPDPRLFDPPHGYKIIHMDAP